MEPAEFAMMYRVEDAHWWYVGLHGLLLAWIDRVAQGRRLRILDAGCGTGRLLSLLSAHDAIGVDLAPAALRFLARRGLTSFARGSIAALPFPDASFDLVVSADVLCCLDEREEAAAIAELARTLAPGGTMLLHLPAFPSLGGEHDVAVSIRRRYRRPQVAALLDAVGFNLRRLTYRVGFPLPLAAPVRLLTRIGLSRRAAPRSDLRLLPAAVNQLLAAVMWTENRALLAGIDLPLGLSVFAVAERNP